VAMSPRLFFTAILLSAPAVWAADAVPPAPTSAPDIGSSALQMVFGLLLVLGLLLGTLWLLKRISQPRGFQAGLMRVVAGISVGARERVVILELGNSWLVLGVAPGRVTTLAEIPRQEVPASATPQAGQDFPAWLNQIIKKRGHA